MNELNPAQHAAVYSNAPTILCIAGPGSGKTHTLVERLKRLVHDRHDPAGFACITFTNAAADELTKRLDGIQLGFCGTLHGFCLRLLQRYGSEIGLPPRLTVLDEEQTEQIIKRTVKELNYKGSLVQVHDVIDAGPKTYPTTQRLTTAQIVGSRFYSKLRSAGIMTFQSLLTYAHLLLTGKNKVGNFTHLFVDEVQDACNADMEIYRALPVANRFMVGDPDQSVFSFRGGNIEHILAMADMESVHKIFLDANYRSDDSICRAAQFLIEHNLGRVPKRMVTTSPDCGSVGLTRFRSEYDEIQAIARQCRIYEGSKAVLLRTNKLVEQYRLGLVSYGIPVAERKRQIRPGDWQTCKALLSLLNDPQNDYLAEGYISMARGEKVAQNAKLAAAAAGLSINDQSLKIPDDISPVESPEILAKAGITRESVEEVAAAAQALQPGDTLADLLLALAEEPKTEEQGGGVTVTTCHSAKGREWDVVFLPAFEQGIIPSSSALKVNGVEEERRLAFVAMTRARHVLQVSHAAERRPPFGHGPELTDPSQFIKEAQL